MKSNTHVLLFSLRYKTLPIELKASSYVVSPSLCLKPNMISKERCIYFHKTRSTWRMVLGSEINFWVIDVMLREASCFSSFSCYNDLTKQCFVICHICHFYKYLFFFNSHYSMKYNSVRTVRPTLFCLFVVVYFGLNSGLHIC